MLKILLLNALLIFHPFHVTITSIEQEQNSDTLKVFFRMYYDDFLNDYKTYNPGSLPDIKSQDKAVSNDQINQYINDRIRIYINNKLLTGKLTDVFKDNFEISLSLYYKSAKKPKKFAIINRVLTGMYSDQTNMVYLNINNYQDAMKLTPGHFKEELNLK